MTISNWFAKNDDESNKLAIKDAVKVLYPAKTAITANCITAEGDRSRFSQLLLEHGEKRLQDWAVIAYSMPITDETGSNGNGSPDGNNNIGEASSSFGYNATNATIQPTQWEQQNQYHYNNINSNYNKFNTRRIPNISKIQNKDLYPTVHMSKIEGRLHLCSRSIVFEPTAHCYTNIRGIVRCPFKKMDCAPVEYPPPATSDDSQNSHTRSTGRFEPIASSIEFRSNRHIVMKEKNVVGPFETVAIPAAFRFTFLHSSPSPFVEVCHQLYKFTSSPSNALPSHVDMYNNGNMHNQKSPEEQRLDEIFKQMLDRPFDLSNLVDVRERPLSSTLKCSLLSPLQAKQGCLIVTMERIYFQAASGVSLTPNCETTTKAIHWPQKDAVAIACRYSGLRDSALEIYFRQATSVLLAFHRKRDREQVLQLLSKNKKLINFTQREFVVAVNREWQKGTINNFEYLLALNSAAGRTFHDLSRYPVFPWVISDYESSKLDLNNPAFFRDLSKPVGALNQARLDYFCSRLESMQDMDQSFLYGTHYSAPGYVLYYLIRSMPEHMLCLQNGKFDAPDRMFHSVSHCFSCALSNHTDVKELIPEFYNANNDYDFLINARGLQLGATQTGDRVDDVKIPPWAKSPKDFIRKQRKALESDICTSMLPKWIDLIFGCKSRGEAAKEAFNLFHPCSYLGPADLATMQNEEERNQAELQATEFGIVPDMLFCGPHPLRHDDVDESFISTEIGLSSSESGGTKADAWELLDHPPSHNGNNPEDHTALIKKKDIDGDLDTNLANQNQFDINNNDASSSAYPSSSMSTYNNIRGPVGAEEVNSNRSFPVSGLGDASDNRATTSGTFSSLQATANGTFSSLQAKVFSQPSSIPDVALVTSNSPTATHSIEGGTGTASTEAWDMNIIDRKQLHGDAVSGCILVIDGANKPLLATASLDGGLMAHTVSLSNDSAADDQNRRGFTGTLSRFSYIAMSRGQVTPSQSQSKLSQYRSHTSRDPLACLTLVSDGAGGQVAFAGGHDDVVLAYGINSACAVSSVYSHRDAVTGLDIISRPGLLSSFGNEYGANINNGNSFLWLENSTHIMVSGSWDATVKVWSVTVAKGETVSVNREPLAELFDADSPIVCVSAIGVGPNGGIVICAGCADGSFCVWNVHNDGVKVVIHNEPAKRGSGPCSVVKWSTGQNGKKHLFTGFSTGKVASFTLEGATLRKESAVSFGVAVNCLVYSEGILLVGCADGGMRLIPVRNGTHFDSKPSLWSSVNSKTSPGISSISITYTGDVQAGLGRCICCTGGEDGSVALFELKKAR